MRNDKLYYFLKGKAKSAPDWANYITSLYPNTWYYCEEDFRIFTGGRHYKLAGLCDSEAGLWFKLEDLK